MNKEGETQCYVCYEGDVKEFADSVCACKGSIKIHKDCLQHMWDNGVRVCSICKIHYKMPQYSGNGLHIITEKDIHNGGISTYTVNSVGKKTGLYQSWYSNGQMWRRCNYVDGEKMGLFQSWYQGGELWEQCLYIHGKKEGLAQVWYGNGRLFEQCTYRNDEYVGQYQWWSYNGELLEDMVYR